MNGSVYRFELDTSVPSLEAEMTLHLAMIAVEGLFGQAAVRLDTTYHVDEPRNAIIVDGTTDAGDALVRVFTSFLIREFGEDAFQVRRVAPAPGAPVAAEGRAA